MKKLLFIFLPLFFLTMLPFTVAASEDHEMPPPYVGSPELQKIKSLAGEWVGTHKIGEEFVEANVTYEVTSNGSAVVETLFPDTSHEMVSIYSDVKGKLTMVHYCALANQPKLDLLSMDENSIQLNFAADNVIDPAKEEHMHGLLIKFVDKDNIAHNWSFYKDGQLAKIGEFKFSRVK